MEIFDRPEEYFQAYIDAGPQAVQALHEAFQIMFYITLAMLACLSLVSILAMAYVSMNKRESFKEKPLEKNFPFVTIQIPTRNEICALTCAQKCLEFDYPKDKYEILIGDDSDKPEISKKIAEFSRKSRKIKVFKREKNEGFKAGNLNNLLKHSKGEYLVLFDSDSEPEPDFLKRIIAPMVHDKNTAAVQARPALSNTDQNMVTILSAISQGIIHQIILPSLNKIRQRSFFICGSAAALRKEILEKKGGWRSGALTEDIEYSMRLLKEGRKIRYLPDLECKSDLPFKLKDLCKQQKRWGYGGIESMKIHFKETFFSKKIKNIDKLLLIYASSFNIAAVGFGLIAILGFLSAITHPSGIINFQNSVFEGLRNTALTSGFLLSGLYALKKMGHFNKAPQAIIAIFSIGIIVAFHVNIGVIRALLNKNLDWGSPTKKNNRIENSHPTQKSRKN